MQQVFHSRNWWCHLDAVEVVHSEDGAPLVLIADEAEPFGLPRLLVSHQVDVDDLAVPARCLGEKGGEMFFSEEDQLRMKRKCAGSY